MQILLSPAKKQVYSDWYTSGEIKQPKFKEEIEELSTYLKQLSVEDIANIMHVSPAIAELNFRRFQDFNCSLWTKNNTGPAIFSFQGDAYKSLSAETLSQDEILWLNSRLYIISGLYGLLRPLDPIQYYRLEMKTVLSGFKHKNLYNYWGEKLRDAVASHNEPCLNLASTEYFKAISIPGAVTIDFKEQSHGMKTIGIMAKRARGLMLRWLAQNSVNDIADVKYFDLGYTYDSSLSSSSRFVFVSIIN